MTSEHNDPEYRKLKKAKINLLRDPKFALWGGVLMVGTTSISDDIPTACTNGRDEIYGRKFIAGLSDRELAFVVLHENLHKALRHLTTWHKLWKDDPRLANMAMDYVINLMIRDMDPAEEKIAMPRGPDGKPMGCIDERFRGLHTKQVYDLLKQEQQSGKGQGQPGEGDGGGFDEHDWAGAQELTEQEKQELVRELDQAIRQGELAAKRMGEGAGGRHRELGELLEPQIDWREALREFVTSVCPSKDMSSWRRFHRRYLSQDLYLPTLIGERVGRIVVGIDTSGSIGAHELSVFLSEVKAIADLVCPEKLDLIYWDSAVAAHETYDEVTMATLTSSTKPAGGGGTDVNAVFTYVKEKLPNPPMVCIIISDGYTPFPAPAPYPVLFVFTTDVVAPWGKTVQIKDG